MSRQRIDLFQAPHSIARAGSGDAGARDALKGSAHDTVSEAFKQDFGRVQGDVTSAIRISAVSLAHSLSRVSTTFICRFRNIIGPQSVCSPWTLHSLIFPHSPHQGLPTDVITS